MSDSSSPQAGYVDEIGSIFIALGSLVRAHKGGGDERIGPDYRLRICRFAAGEGLDRKRLHRLCNDAATTRKPEKIDLLQMHGMEPIFLDLLKPPVTGKG